MEADINNNDNVYSDNDMLLKDVMHSLTPKLNHIHDILCCSILFDSISTDGILMYCFRNKHV